MMYSKYKPAGPKISKEEFIKSFRAYVRMKRKFEREVKREEQE